MVGACAGERVGPFGKVRREERASQGKVEDARAPNRGHGKVIVYSQGVKEGIAQLRRPVKIGGRGGYFVLTKAPKGVGCGVVDVQVSQSKGRLCGSREDHVSGDRASVL